MFLSEEGEGEQKIIRSKWQQLKQGKDDWNHEQKELITQLLKDIEIEALERFTTKTFYDHISDHLNLQKFRQTQTQTRNERLLETFNINGQNSFKHLLKGEKIVSLDGDQKIGLAELLDCDFFVRDGSREFLRICLLSRYRENGAMGAVRAAGESGWHRYVDEYARLFHGA